MTLDPQERAAIARRKPQIPETLAIETTRWLSALPPEVRPKLLPNAYSRIANALCRKWEIPRECIDYFDELLIDKRGNRRGFPVGIAIELANLKNHYETNVHPSRQTWWDHIAV